MMSRVSFRAFVFSGCVLVSSLMSVAVSAQEAVQVTSQPDEVAIFYNNVAFVRDTVQLPGESAVQIALPSQVYAETLIVRENGRRVMNYTLVTDGRLLIEWDSTTTEATREVTLQYLIAGLSWTPKYDMFIEGQAAERVGFDFFAQINNGVLDSEAVNVRLIAGSVALSTTYDGDYAAAPAMNQTIAGYAESTVSQPVLTGSTTIQYIYNAGTLALETGETQYIGLLSTDLAARRLNLWNAGYDAQVYSIYKITNSADMPFADGMVRSYQDGMFLGTDGIELTPISSEGSVTVGTLQNVRVDRSESRESLNTIFYSEQVSVTLELENFSSEAITIEVVDAYPSSGREYTFSTTPEEEGDNLYRWIVTIPAGETTTITYGYKI